MVNLENKQFGVDSVVRTLKRVVHSYLLYIYIFMQVSKTANWLKLVFNNR